jgi:hypothetical protein
MSVQMNTDDDVVDSAGAEYIQEPRFQSRKQCKNCSNEKMVKNGKKKKTYRKSGRIVRLALMVGIGMYLWIRRFLSRALERLGHRGTTDIQITDVVL